MRCRHCGEPLQQDLVDLGTAPPSNAYLRETDLAGPQAYYPLRIKVCNACWLVQTEDYTDADALFSDDYAYFSSTSTSWLTHAARYATMITERLSLHAGSLVVELAANDGYLLKNFIASGIPCLGVEPTASTAAAAESLGIPIVQAFFGETLAHQLVNAGRQADLIIGNNVYAHVPDINDFTRGLSTLLKPGGTITLEFPHLLNLLEQTQFDTIYHEHFSYLSLYAVTGIFAKAGLRIHDVETLPTHGGSLRVYGCHVNDPREDAPAVAAMLAVEGAAGLQQADVYRAFQGRVDSIKNAFLSFLIDQKREGRTIAAYGAAAKGNTLLNYAGVRPDLLPWVCDAAPAKQGRYLPGSRIPILSPDMIRQARPQLLLVLPWNIVDEVVAQHDYIRAWGGRFVTAVPTLELR